MIAGNCSEKLTVRKKAIDSAESAWSCDLAHETFGDRGRAFKAGTGAERRDRGPATTEQSAPGRARAFGSHAFDALDQLIERDRPPPGEHLACELLGARARALKRHEQAGLHLCLGTGDLSRANG